MTLRLKIFWLIVLMALPCFGQSPASELRRAKEDLARLPESLHSTTCYLTLYTIPPADRAEAARVLGYTLNALSRTRVIAPISADNYVSDTLIRIDLTNYTLTPEEFRDWYNA